MDNITRAIHDELVLSYTQSARVVPTTVAVVAASLRDALGFADEEEVHKAFTKARDMADVRTFGALTPGKTVTEGEALFSRLDEVRLGQALKILSSDSFGLQTLLCTCRRQESDAAEKYRAKRITLG